MRSGLLAVGVILLVLGAIFYFLPGPTTQTGSVQTTTYLTYGNTGYNTGSNGLDLANGYTGYSNTGYNNTYNNSNGLDVASPSYNTYNTGSSYTNTGYTTTTDNSIFANTGYNTQYDSFGRASWNKILNTGYQQSTTMQNGIETIYILMDANGNIYPANPGDVQNTGFSANSTYRNTGSSYSNTGYTGSNTASNTVTNNGNSYTNTGYTGTSANSSNGSMQTGSASNSVYATLDNSGTANSGASSTANSADTTNTAYNTQSTTGTTGATQTTGVTNTGSTTGAAVGVANGSFLHTLSVWMMVIGALLTILGLVLPTPAHVHTTRTTGAAGRRVEREEERRP